MRESSSAASSARAPSPVPPSKSGIIGISSERDTVPTTRSTNRLSLACPAGDTTIVRRSGSAVRRPPNPVTSSVDPKCVRNNAVT